MTARNVTRLTNMHDRSDLYAHVQVGRGPTSVPCEASSVTGPQVRQPTHFVHRAKLQERWGLNSNYCPRLSTLYTVMRLLTTGYLIRNASLGDLIIIIIIYLFTAIGLLPGGSGYFTCKQNMKLVTTRFKSGGLHEKHVVATWNVGGTISAFAYRHRETKKNLCRGGRSQDLPNTDF